MSKTNDKAIEILNQRKELVDSILADDIDQTYLALASIKIGEPFTESQMDKMKDILKVALNWVKKGENKVERAERSADRLIEILNN